MKADLGKGHTNVSGGVESNVNVGFGSKTVDQLFPPRVKNLISDWDRFGLMRPITANESRTEEEIPPSKLALVLSPLPLHLRGVGEQGDIAREGRARSASRNHVGVRGPSRTRSRYPRSSSRLGVGNSFDSRSHSGLLSASVGMDVVDALDGTPDRRDSSGLRKGLDEERRVQFPFSHSNTRSRIDDLQGELQDHRRGIPNAGGADHPNNLSPDLSFPSDSEIRDYSPTARSLSPRTEVLSGSCRLFGDKDPAPAIRWGLRLDAFIVMAVAGKTGRGVGGRGNELGGVGDVDGCHPSRRLSVVTGDGGGKEGLGCDGASRDMDAQDSRCSSPSCSGSCVGGADYGSRSLLAGSCSTAFSRSRFPGLSSDRGSVLGSHLRHEAKDQIMGDTPSPDTRAHLLVPRHLPTPGFIRAATPSPSSKPFDTVPFTYGPGAFRANAQLNTNMDTSWSTQTQQDVHPDTQEFDSLRFSSSSPSTPISGSTPSFVSAPRNLHLGQDKFDEDTDGDVCNSRSGFNRRLTLNEGLLRSDMKYDMKPDLNLRIGGLNGGVDKAVRGRDGLGRPLTSKFINNWGEGDEGGELGYVAGVEHRDMGGMKRDRFGPVDPRGRASLISGSVSVAGDSGVSAADLLLTRALSVRTRFYDEDGDIRSPASLESRMPSIQSRSVDHPGGGDGELEECGLLRSLLESSDPWSLMKRKALNLPSPTPEEIERGRGRENRDEVKGSLGRRGVGYVTPPSMGTLLGVGGPNDEMEMEVEEDRLGGDELEDSQEILDFRSSQPRTGLFSFSFVGRAEQALTH